MEAPLVIAGALALIAAAIHGGVGEVKVVRYLSAQELPGTPLGGPRMTRAMIHVTWHLTTVAFLAVGCALLLSGTVLGAAEARPLALVAAGAAVGFAALALGLGAANTRSARTFVKHPGPLVLSLTAALALWGALAL